MSPAESCSPAAAGPVPAAAQPPAFAPLAPGGRRLPLQYDPKGNFALSLDRRADQIVVRHHLPDHAPAHEVRGRNGSSILLGLIREGLVSRLSHAGYPGAELAKAEAGPAARAALRAGPAAALRRRAGRAGTGAAAHVGTLDAEHLALTPAGSAVQVALRVEAAPERGLLECTLLDPAEPGSGPRSYRASTTRVRARRDDATQVVMGGSEDLVAGALLRVQGELSEPGVLAAERIAVLTNVVSVLALTGPADGGRIRRVRYRRRALVGRPGR